MHGDFAIAEEEDIREQLRVMSHAGFDCARMPEALHYAVFLNY